MNLILYLINFLMIFIYEQNMNRLEKYTGIIDSPLFLQLEDFS